MQEGFKLYFERSGGFMGTTLKVEIDSKELSPDEKGKLQALIDSTNFFNFNNNDSSGNPLPDQFQYKLSIENVSQSHSVEFTESTVPKNWEPLLQYLSSKARRKKGN